MKRGRGDFLTDKEEEDLHRLIRAGVKSVELAERFNICVRTVNVHKAKMEGRGRYSRFNDKGRPAQFSGPICRVGDCQETGTGRPPYCAEHRPEPKAPGYSSFIAPIPLSRLMGGK